MWKKKSSSNKVGGGDIGVIVGIVHDTMTGDGVIIMVIQPGIKGFLMTGEITIETICGTDDPGIIILFITVTWIDIGEAIIGKITMVGDILMEPVIVVDLIVALGIDTQDNSYKENSVSIGPTPH
jgi:hypothetical protein